MMRVGTGPTGAQPNPPANNPPNILRPPGRNSGENTTNPSKEMSTDNGVEQEQEYSSRKTRDNNQSFKGILQEVFDRAMSGGADMLREGFSTILNNAETEQDQALTMDMQSKALIGTLTGQTTSTVNMGVSQMLNASGPKYPVQPMAGGCGCGMGMMPWGIGGFGFGWGGGCGWGGAPLGVC